MTERTVTLVQRQVRLVLEQQCAAAFGVLWPLLPPRVELTLLFFDYAPLAPRAGAHH